MPDQILYHLIPEEDLEACRAKGVEYFPRTYKQDGFTHLTADTKLLLPVANLFYKDSKSNWLLLVLNTAALTAEVKYEPAAPVGSKPAKAVVAGEKPQIFPHLYGGINLGAIEKELPVERDPLGQFIAIQGL